jgi:hypothetical protein
MALSELVASQGQESVATTFHTVGYPIGYSEGDLLVLLFSVASGTDTVSGIEAEWTLRASGVHPTDGGYIYMYTRSAPVNPGGPSAVANVETSIAEQSSYICFGFTDAEIDSVLAQNNSVSAGTSITPNSYSLGPTDSIYVSYAVYGNTDATPSITAWPTNHTETQINVAQSGMGLAAASTAVRATLPGGQTFTSDSSGLWRAGGFVVTEIVPGSPITLDRIAFNVSLTDISAATLERIAHLVAVNPIEAEPTTLERLEYAVSLETQFSAIRMVRNSILPIAPVPASNSLTLLPPLGLLKDDTFGALLQGDMPGAETINFNSERYVSRKDLSGLTLTSDGDYVLFRYDGEAIFIVNREVFTASGGGGTADALADFTANGININQALAPVALTSGTLDSGWSNSSGTITYTGSPTLVEIALNIHAAIDNAANIQRPAAVVEIWRDSTLLATYATGYIRDATDHEEASWSGYFIDRSPGTNPDYEIRTRSDSTNLGAVTTQAPSTVVFRAIA